MHDLACFSGIEDSDLVEKILDSARTEHFSEGALIAKGGVADALRIIVEGSIEIFHDTGAPTILVDGECFGFSWALGVSPYSDAKAARALSNVECLVLYDIEVQKILERQPSKGDLGLRFAPLPSKLQGRPSTPSHQYLQAMSMEHRPSTPFQKVPVSTCDAASDCESSGLRSRSSSPRSRSPRTAVPISTDTWYVEKFAGGADVGPSHGYHPQVVAPPPRNGSKSRPHQRPLQEVFLPPLAQQQNLPGICSSTWPPSRKTGEATSSLVRDHFPMPPTKPKAPRKPNLPLSPEHRPCTVE
jgi:hypothetical protein